MTSAVAAFRTFNRFYTRKIGVLQEGHLESPFSLTEVRVLYELAHRQQPTAATICKDLELDPGYLSRMLGGFQKRGLVRKARSASDARQSLLELTPQGRRQFETLDRRANLRIASLLKPLHPIEQAQLVEHLRKVESLLGAKPPSGSHYTLRAHRPGDMGWVVNRHGVLYWNEYHYDERFEALVAEIVAHFVQHFNPKVERCWIAEMDGEPIGTVFLVRKSQTVAKLRLLLVEPAARGMGIGKRLVEECVRFAREAGYKKITLWTQSELTSARNLYKAAGFELAGKHKHDSWSRTNLVAEVWELKLSA
ncbi:MAG TPA: helix-turn-helix domain-containing GNAT family N-acetyltransferase [Terriglobales bacterium]|nr:helix-turn-helix domain-containing GNAT family N-acetyltransferase [Terriglobales bacterium]